MGAKLNRVYDLGRGEKQRRERQRRGEERTGKEREGEERKRNELSRMKQRNTTGLFCYSDGYLTECEM